MVGNNQSRALDSGLVNITTVSQQSFMRRVEKPIKCLPVSDIQKMGLRCLLLGQSECSSDSPQPMRGQQMDHRYSRDQVKSDSGY